MGTVSSQLTRIHDVEGALTLTSIGGGAGGGVNTEIFIQGSQSSGRKQSNAADHGFWLQVPTRNISAQGVHVGIWINHIHFAVLTKFAARLGSTTANYHEHSFPLGQYPALGGWVRFWADVGRTPEASAGAFDKSALTQVGVLASLPAVGGNAPNIIMDASDFTSGGLVLTGSGGVWNDFVSSDEGSGVNKYGVVTTSSGVIFCLARLTLGSASALQFSDSGFVIVFPNQATVAANFMGITVDLSNAGTDVDWADAVLRSAGSVRGDLIVQGTIGSFNAAGCAFGNLRVLTLTSGAALQGCSISGCGLVTAAGAALLSCDISGSSAAVAVFWDGPDTDGRLDGATFTAGVGHALELGPNTPSEITLRDVDFVGYGASGSINAAVYNNSGKAITVNVVGGGSPTVRNGTGASTNVVADPRTFSFTVLDSSGSQVTGYEWHLYEDDPTQGIIGLTELSGEESAGSSTQNYPYSHAGDVDVVLQVMHPDFVEAIHRDTLGNADKAVTVVLVNEENV